MVAGGRPPRAIRVLIAERDRLLAQKILRTLSADERIDVIGAATNAEEAAELALSLVPDLILMGIDIPAIDGTEATCRIRKTVPSVRVIVVGRFERQREIDLALGVDAAALMSTDAYSSAGVMAAVIALTFVRRPVELTHSARQGTGSAFAR
jgi:DNA-binding NarL/FixJ family response regulator